MKCVGATWPIANTSTSSILFVLGLKIELDKFHKLQFSPPPRSSECDFVKQQLTTAPDFFHHSEWRCEYDCLTKDWCFEINFSINSRAVLLIPWGCKHASRSRKSTAQVPGALLSGRGPKKKTFFSYSTRARPLHEHSRFYYNWSALTFGSLIGGAERTKGMEASSGPWYM